MTCTDSGFSLRERITSSARTGSDVDWWGRLRVTAPETCAAPVRERVTQGRSDDVRAPHTLRIVRPRAGIIGTPRARASTPIQQHWPRIAAVQHLAEKRLSRVCMPLHSILEHAKDVIVTEQHEILILDAHLIAAVLRQHDLVVHLDAHRQ